VAFATTEFFACEAPELNVKAVELKCVCEWELNDVHPPFKLLLCVLFLHSFPGWSCCWCHYCPCPGRQLSTHCARPEPRLSQLFLSHPPLHSSAPVNSASGGIKRPNFAFHVQATHFCDRMVGIFGLHFIHRFVL